MRRAGDGQAADRREFPEVPSITAAKLAALLADKDTEKPFLIDVRTRQNSRSVIAGRASRRTGQ